MYELFIVTSLAAEGPGSLAEALNYRAEYVTIDGVEKPKKTRVVVFDISGEIEWTYDAALKSLADGGPRGVIVKGDTAPGDGITITGHPFYLLDSRDVKIEGIRFELPTAPSRRQSNSWGNLRVITSSGCQSRNITIDHCTFYGGEDEQLSVTPLVQYAWQDSTPDVPHIVGLKVTNCLFGPAFTLHRGNHNFAALVSLGDDILFENNLFMHANRRSPQVQGTQVTIRGNVIYNYGSMAVGCMAPGDYQVYDNLFILGYNSNKTFLASPITLGTTGTSGDVLIEHNNNMRLKRGTIPFAINLPVDNQTDNHLDEMINGLLGRADYQANWINVETKSGSRRLELDEDQIERYRDGLGGWCRTQWAFGGYDTKKVETSNVLLRHGILKQGD